MPRLEFSSALTGVQLVKLLERELTLHMDKSVIVGWYKDSTDMVLVWVM